MPKRNFSRDLLAEIMLNTNRSRPNERHRSLSQAETENLFHWGRGGEGEEGVSPFESIVNKHETLFMHTYI